MTIDSPRGPGSKPPRRAAASRGTATRCRPTDELLALCRGFADGEAYVLRFAAHLGREEIARGLGRAPARRTEVQALRAVAADSREPS